MAAKAAMKAAKAAERAKERAERLAAKEAAKEAAKAAAKAAPKAAPPPPAKSAHSAPPPVQACKDLLLLQLYSRIIEYLGTSTQVRTVWHGAKHSMLDCLPNAIRCSTAPSTR